MQTAPQTIKGHFGPFTPFNYPTNQQFDKCKKGTYKFHHSIWVYQKSYRYDLQLPRNDAHISTSPSLPFPPFLAQKIIISHQRTKNHNQMIFNLQNMMQIPLQVILGHLSPKNFFKKEKNTWVYHHFTPASQKSQSFDVQFLKNDADSITGYSWSIFAILFHFSSKIKIFKKWKNT